MFGRVLTLAAAYAGLLVPGPLSAQTLPPPNDYSQDANWLCRPGAARNACDTDLTTTVVAADGSLTEEHFKADARAAIDCFYVYPTVSIDPGLLATMQAEREETTVIAQQFARFGAKCRTFAPLYRQVTLTALVSLMQGKPMPGMTGARPVTPYQDVLDAWKYYLSHDNHGRGVVLVGHSQGSGVLTQLIKSEIDGKPAQARLVSAILMGTSLAVAKGSDVGGDFKTVPLCHSVSQVGCVIAYASFRDTSPPPENSRFGRPHLSGDNLAAACVNPANLAGGRGELRSYLANGTVAIAGSLSPTGPWVKGKSVTTPFVSTPGLLTAECVSTPTFSYLSVHTVTDSASPRTQSITGDVIFGGQLQKDWGLHLIDVNLAMGNLLEIVGAEAKAWAAAKR